MDIQPEDYVYLPGGKVVDKQATLACAAQRHGLADSKSFSPKEVKRARRRVNLYTREDRQDFKDYLDRKHWQKWDELVAHYAKTPSVPLERILDHMGLRAVPTRKKVPIGTPWDEVVAIREKEDREAVLLTDRRRESLMSALLMAGRDPATL